MTGPNNTFVVLSASCQGLRDLKKLVDVINYYKETESHITCPRDLKKLVDFINYYKETESHITCLQDTHLTENDTNNFMVVLPTLGELLLCFTIILSLRSTWSERTKMETT